MRLACQGLAISLMPSSEILGMSTKHRTMEGPSAQVHLQQVHLHPSVSSPGQVLGSLEGGGTNSSDLVLEQLIFL